MSYKSLLNYIAENKPIFDVQYAVLNAPVRQLFIIATVWYLTQKKKNPDVNILEIGSWYGASTLSWAQALEEYNDCRGQITCVDAWQPFFDRDTHQETIYKAMESVLSTDFAYNIFLHNISTLNPKISCQHFRGKSDTVLPTLREAHFDIVFIDADHSYDGVKKDIILSKPLVKDGGIICGDDLNLQLHQCDPDFARGHKQQDFIADPKTNRKFHPGVTVAVAESFGEVSSWGGYWAMQKRAGNWEKISLKRMPIVYPKHLPQHLLTKAQDHFADIDVT